MIEEQKMSNKKLVLYVHGKGGSAKEAEHYISLFPDCDVIGFDYLGNTPWDTEAEFQNEYDILSAMYDGIILIANSIGAYFAMNALHDRRIEKAYFISPIVNMEKLIMDMIGWAETSEEELRKKGEIQTAFGEKLSWEYLEYVRKHPICWEISTKILYATGDHLVSQEAINAFAESHNAELCVMHGGEHWFHTEEQMAFLNQWIESN